MNYKRLENNQFAMLRSHDRFLSADKDTDENQIYSSIGETLLWIITTEEWHKLYNPNYSEVKKMIVGF